MTSNATHRHALLFGLNEELAGELRKPLTDLCGEVRSVSGDFAGDSIPTDAVIFCGPDASVVSGLRQAKPDAHIVVVSRHPEVSDWLDSIEAGATDYCAAPFETAQVRWILQSTHHSVRV